MRHPFDDQMNRNGRRMHGMQRLWSRRKDRSAWEISQEQRRGRLAMLFAFIGMASATILNVIALNDIADLRIEYMMPQRPGIIEVLAPDRLPRDL